MDKKFILKRLFLSLVYCVWIFSSDTIAAEALTKDFLATLPDGLVEHIESEYNDIYITKEDALIRMAVRRHRFEYTESARDIKDDKALPVPYTQVMTLGLVYQGEPKKIIMLGLGGGTTTRYMKDYYPETSFEIIELDQAVIKLAKKYFAVKETDKYKIINSDARVYLRRQKQKYDLIMIDAFRGGTIPFHLLTQEFYELLKRRMHENSYVVINLHGGTKLFESSIKTLNSVFQSVDAYPIKRGNVIIVAYQKTNFDDFTLSFMAGKLQKKHQFYYDMREMVMFKRKIQISPEAKILTDDFAPVNIYKTIRSNNTD